MNLSNYCCLLPFAMLFARFGSPPVYMFMIMENFGTGGHLYIPATTLSGGSACLRADDVTKCEIQF